MTNTNNKQSRLLRAPLWVLGLFVFVLLAVALLPHSRPAVAATSSTLNFQAKLMAGTGAIVPDGNYNVEFKLYNASSSSGSSQGSCTGDSACLWTETRTGANVVRVANGYLTVNLGSVTSFPSTINWDQPLYLTMNIGGTGAPSWDGEMSPRLTLTAVPYAFRAGQLATNSGGNVATLGFTTPTANRSILLPDEGGTVCLQNATSCGFAASSGSGNYIQNGTSPQTANFNITGTGKLAVLDSTGTTLSIGPSATGGITLQQNTTLASGKTLTVQGNATFQAASNSTTAFAVKTSGGSSVLDVDTTNGYVGIGTASPGRILDVAASNSQTTAPMLLLEQASTGDSTLEFKTPAKSFIIGQDTSDGSKLKISSSVASGGSSTLGYTAVGGTNETGQNHAVSCNKFTSSVTGLVSSISVYAGTIDNTNPYFQAGIYTDDGGSPSSPSTLVANSGTGTVLVNAWATVSLSASVTSGQVYWLCYETEASSSSLNQLKYDTGSANQTVVKFGVTMGTWNSSFGTPDSHYNDKYSEYATVTPTGAYDSFTKALVTIGDAGQTTFQNSTDSTQAFQVQNAAGASVFNVDASNQRIGVNTSSPSANLVVAQGTLAPGTLATTAASANVTGTSTTFTSTFYPGDQFTVSTTSNTCTVKSITDDTHLVCVSTLASTTSGSAYTLTKSTRLVVQNNGYMGINNAAPTVDLDVGPATLQTGQIIQTRIGDFLLQSQQGGANGLAALTSRGSNGNLTLDGASGSALYLSAFTTNNNFLAAGGGKVRVGDQTTPTYKLDVAGDINSTTALRIAGTSVCDTTGSTGCIAKSGSGYYIHNQTTVQAANLYVQAATTGTVAAVFQAFNGGAGDIMDLLNGTGTTVAKFASNGDFTLTAALTQSGGAVSLQGSAASSFTTTAGALTLTSAASANWTVGGTNQSLTITTSGTGLLTIGTTGAGTVTLGSSSATINIGAANNAHAIHIGDAGTSTTQTITIGSTNGSSATTIQGGTGSSAINLTSGTNGTINLTANGTGSIDFTTNSSSAKFLFQSGTNSATALQVKNALGTNDVLNVDTSNVRVGINTSSPSYTLDVLGDANVFTNYKINGNTILGSGQLSFANAGAGTVQSNSSQALTITGHAASTWSTDSGALTIQGSGGVTINTPNTVTASSAITIQSGNSSLNAAGNVSIDTGTTFNGTPTVQLGATNAKAVTIGNTGATVTLQGTGTTAFRVLNSSGAVQLTVDSTNSRVILGTSGGDATGTVIVLGNKTGSSADPTGVAGAMYYNTTLARFRCYEDGNWKNCIGFDSDDNRKYPFASNDFLTTANTAGAGYIPWVQGATASGTMSLTPSEANHQGIINFNGSGTTNGGWRVITDQNVAPQNILLTGGEATEAVFRVITTTNTTVRTGFHNATTSTAPSNGVYFEIVGTTLSCKSANAGTRTTGATTLTITASTWYRAKIVIASDYSSATCLVYNDSGTQLLSTSVSTNLPTAATGNGVIATNSGTGSASLLDLDYLSMWWTVAQTR